jgi:hypothetical protein
MNYRILTLCAPLLLGIALMGCNSEAPSGTVSGTIKLSDGTVVPVGFVNFIAKDGKAGAATIQKDGSYKALSAPLGTCKVTVSAPPPRAPDAPKDIMGGGVDPIPLPAMYADKDKTDLTFEVKSGANTFDITLKK